MRVISADFPSPSRRSIPVFLLPAAREGDSPERAIGRLWLPQARLRASHHDRWLRSRSRGVCHGALRPPATPITVMLVRAPDPPQVARNAKAPGFEPGARFSASGTMDQKRTFSEVETAVTTSLP